MDICPYLHSKLILFNKHITWTQFKHAISRLANDKIPGLNGVSPNAFKYMEEDIRVNLYEHILAFWKGEDDYEE